MPPAPALPCQNGSKLKRGVAAPHEDARIDASLDHRFRRNGQSSDGSSRQRERHNHSGKQLVGAIVHRQAKLIQRKSISITPVISGEDGSCSSIRREMCRASD